MTQIPQFFGARLPAISRRSVQAFALWRSRDGLTTPVTENTPITYGSVNALTRRIFKDSVGNMLQISRNMPRSIAWDLDGDGICETPALVVTDIINSQNRCGFSEDFTNWTAVNSGTILTPTIDLQAVTLSLLSDTSGSLQRYWERTVVTGGAASQVLSFYLAKGTINAAGGASATLRDNTASANRILTTWTWSVNANGFNEPNFTVTTGSLISKEFVGRKYFQDPTTNLLTIGDVWRISLKSTNAYVNTNNNSVRLGPANTANQQGNEFFGGVMLSNTPQPYIKNTGSTAVTSDDETWSMAFEGVPQAMTLAVRLVYNGESDCYAGAGGDGCVAFVSNPTGSGFPLFSIYCNNGATAKFNAMIADGVNPALRVNHTFSPSLNADLLLRVALRGDGSLAFGMSERDGAESVVVSGNPYGIPAAWSANSAIRLNEATSGCFNITGVGAFAGEPPYGYIWNVIR